MLSNEAVKKRYAGIQSFFQVSCLFLSLCSIIEQVTEEKVDVLDMYRYCRTQGYLDDADDLTVEGQCRFLGDLTGKKWVREVMKALPKEVPDEMFTVEKWVNVRTGATHFRRRFVDTLKNSVTVKEGSLTDYYCYSWR